MTHQNQDPFEGKAKTNMGKEKKAMGLDCSVGVLLINLRLIYSESCPDQDRKLEIISLSNCFPENYFK